MGQQTETKDVKVNQGGDQVPDKVAAGHGLDHARGARVAPYPLLKVGLGALLIDKNDPEGEGVDQGALDERDDVGVPVGLLAPRVLGVVLGEEEVRDDRRDDHLDEGVEERGADHLVHVEGQRREGE